MYQCATIVTGPPPQSPDAIIFLCRLLQLSLSHIITEDEMNGIIHRQEGVVITFLNRIYEVLTQRKYVLPHIKYSHAPDPSHTPHPLSPPPLTPLPPPLLV